MKKKLSQVVAEKLHKAINESELEKKEIAQKIGISRQGLHSLATHKHKVSLDQLERIAEVFNKPVEYFLSDPEKVIQKHKEEGEMRDEIDMLVRENSKLKDKLIEALERATE